MPVVAIDTTFILDEQLSSLTIDASTVYILPLSDSDTQSLGGTIDTTLDFATGGGVPSMDFITANGSAISPLNPFSLTLGAPPTFGVMVTVTGAVADITTPNPPGMLTQISSSPLDEYQFDASIFAITLNQGIVESSGAVSQTIDLATNPVTGTAPVGTLGSLTLTPAGAAGTSSQYDALLEIPVSFTQVIDINGQMVTLDVDGDIVARSSFIIDMGGYAADFDGDGGVDGEDLSKWQMAYGATDMGDADGDGDSDGADFLVWQREFGSLPPPLAASRAVPEPTSLFFCLGLAAGICPLFRQLR